MVKGREDEGVSLLLFVVLELDHQLSLQVVQRLYSARAAVGKWDPGARCKAKKTYRERSWLQGLLAGGVAVRPENRASAGVARAPGILGTGKRSSGKSEPAVGLTGIAPDQVPDQ